MRVKYLAEDYNAVSRPGLEPGPPDPESSALTIRPPRLSALLVTGCLFGTGRDTLLESVKGSFRSSDN